MSHIRKRQLSAAKHCIICGTQLFSGGHAECKGKSYTMEDFCTIVGEFAGPNTQFYGVFDGHGGSECSAYVGRNLHQLIAKKLIGHIESPQNDEIFSAIQNSINEINEYAIEQWKNQGTTIAIAIIIKDMLYTANVGDSRILLVDKNAGKVVERLSYDHKASDINEQKKILANDGFIQNDRVAGYLALSRAIGDGGLAGIISCEATVKATSYAHNQSLVLFCDGVADVVNDDEIAKIIKDQGEAAAAALQIKRESIERVSNDNVTVVCVDLRPKSEHS
ncbi:Protein phosphatase 2C 1 [Tritrichomonas foetus]|uniref:Protein phosphatase 2C 1 n=1 Tax=Tritrichomonas foetus TaxID=1144522 RepID=A0A1J4JXS0_9EUKA|nr:Protein phosphatase 2C 1 [Tritrichomonas foetus]|eukprot:OHT03256.1 Protein phosphatase 2C 1 [Tritrichomonas foetus]